MDGELDFLSQHMNQQNSRLIEAKATLNSFVESVPVAVKAAEELLGKYDAKGQKLQQQLVIATSSVEKSADAIAQNFRDVGADVVVAIEKGVARTLTDHKEALDSHAILSSAKASAGVLDRLTAKVISTVEELASLKEEQSQWKGATKALSVLGIAMSLAGGIGWYVAHLQQENKMAAVEARILSLGEGSSAKLGILKCEQKATEKGNFCQIGKEGYSWYVKKNPVSP